MSGQVDVIESHPARRLREPTDGIDERGLAGAVRSDQTRDDAGPQLEAHVVDCDHRSVANRQALDRQRPRRDSAVVVHVSSLVSDIGEIDRVRPAPLPRLLDRAGDLDPLRGDAVLVGDEREQDADTADQLDPSPDPIPRRLDPLLVDARRGQRATDERAEQLADPAEERQADVRERAEDVERTQADAREA